MMPVKFPPINIIPKRIIQTEMLSTVLIQRNSGPILSGHLVPGSVAQHPLRGGTYDRKYETRKSLVKESITPALAS